MLRAKSPKKFVSGFSGRLHALARAHTLLTESSWQGADVSGLIRDQVTLGANGDPRISYSGPAMILDPQTAVKLALFLHELGTYARKHGALSVPEGRLSASLEVRMNGVDEFCLKWVESGGPKVSHPSEPGFGTTLIEQSLLACGGQVSVDYAEQGLRCQIALPFSEPIRIDDSDRKVAPATEAFASLSDPPLVMPDRADKRILVIEDEILLSMDIETSLTEAGCQVIGPAPRSKPQGSSSPREAAMRPSWMPISAGTRSMSSRPR